jgi:diguanylate cyclase (GGDEF)-like protein
MRVCVADDDDVSAAILCNGLKMNNYDAFECHSGTEALEACAEGDVALILLDVGFPDISGFEVCQRLKSDPATKDIIVVFATAKDAEDDVAEGYRLGAADYITKPFNLPMVMIRVDAALRSVALKEHLRPEEIAACDTLYTDCLTGLRNHRYLLERLQEEVEKAHRFDYPVSCVVFDLDEVNGIDCELGPVSLDDLLVELAMTVRNHSRTYDVVARYDGTMLAAVLPHTPLQKAVDYAEKIQGEVDATTFSDPSFPTEVKLRAGIVTYKDGKVQGADGLLGEAMRNLLQAKSQPDQRFVARDLAGDSC